jgi:hypothetical protein
MSTAASMQFFPAEVATPPLALVALLGCPGLHGIVGDFLRAAQKPPINTLGIADPAMAARLFGERPLAHGRFLRAALHAD